MLKQHQFYNILKEKRCAAWVAFELVNTTYVLVLICSHLFKLDFFLK